MPEPVLKLSARRRLCIWPNNCWLAHVEGHLVTHQLTVYHEAKKHNEAWGRLLKYFWG